jgi:hypothetical protein
LEMYHWVVCNASQTLLEILLTLGPVRVTVLLSQYFTHSMVGYTFRVVVAF